MADGLITIVGVSATAAAPLLWMVGNGDVDVSVSELQPRDRAIKRRNTTKRNLFASRLIDLDVRPGPRFGDKTCR